MWKLVLKLAINAVAIWVAAQIVPGMTLDTGQPLAVLLVALVFGIVNALLKPVLTVLGLPFIIVTLGLFLVVINAAMLGVTAALTDALAVSGFWPAVGGGVCVSVVSWFLELFLSSEDEDD